MALINLDTKESTSSNQIRKFTQHIQVPYISSSYMNDKHSKDELWFYSIGTNPDWSFVSQAFIDLVSFIKWKKFMLLYEDSNGIFFLKFF